MKIVASNPPVYDAICAHIGVPSENAVFCYGNTIYNPSGLPLPNDLLAHEARHMKQQGDKVDEWWHEYLNDQVFRLNQEAEAYGAQYRYLAVYEKDREKRNRMLMQMAVALSSPLYGNIITADEAFKLIRKSAGV